KRVEEKREKKLPTKAPPPVPMVDASRLGGVVNIDATDQIAGRLCSKVAKLILLGKRVTVVNADRALISGARNSVIRQWMEKSEGRGGEEGGEGDSRSGPGAEAGGEEGGEEESPTKVAGQEGQALFWGEKDCQGDRLDLSGHGEGQGQWTHP